MILDGASAVKDAVPPGRLGPVLLSRESRSAGILDAWVG